MRTVKNRNRVGAWVALLLAFSVNQALADTEPNNTLATANALVMGEIMNGTLNVDPGDVSDWYAFTTTDDGVLNLSLSTDPDLLLNAIVVRPNGMAIASFNSLEGNNFQVDCIAGDQVLYVHLQHLSGSGAYVLNATMINTVPGDIEPNNSLNSASQTLELGSNIQGSLGFVNNGSSDNNDYFLIDIPVNGNVNIQIDAPEEMQTRLYLTRANGNSLVSTSSPGEFGSHSIEYDCIGAAVYVIRVQLNNTSVCGGYTLSYTLDSPTEANDQEPNNSVSQTPETITVDAGVTGQIAYTTDGSADPNDYFLVELQQNGTVHLSIETSDELTTRLYLIRTTGSSINSDPVSGVEGTHTLSTSCIGAGTYVARVQSINGCGGYTLSVSVDEPELPEDIEPNDSLGAVQETIEELEVTTGHLGHTFEGSTDSQDYFHINIDRNGSVVINANVDDALTLRLNVLRTNGSVLFSSPAIGFSGSESFELPCYGEGTYVVRLDHVSGCGAYDLTYEVIDPEFADDIEPNNTIGTAQGVVDENEVVSGHLGHVNGSGSTDGIDYFEIETPVNGTLVIHFNLESSLTGRCFQYKPNGGAIFSSEASGFSGESSFSVECQSADTYYIALSRVSGCGSYTFYYEVLPPAQANDVEPNGTIALSNETLVEGEIKEGQLGHISNLTTDNDDYFIVEKDRNGDITFSVETTNDLVVRLLVHRPNGVVLASSPIEGATSVTLDLPCRGVETQYITVRKVSGCGGYSLSYEIQDPVFNDDAEPNNSLATAEQVSAGAIIEGHLGYTSDVTGSDASDYFRFTVVEAPFEFEATALVADGLTARLWLYQTNGSAITSTSTDGFSDEETLSFTLANAGDYIFRISQISDCGSYQVNGLCGVIPTASIDVDGSLTYCVSDEPTLIGNDDQLTYSWSYGGNEVGTDQSIEVTSPGTYTLVTGDINTCFSLPVEVEAEVVYLPGDYNFDGAVNSSDLLFLLGSFGCMQDCDTDLDGDDMVTSSDLLVFLTVFGTFCVTP